MQESDVDMSKLIYTNASFEPNLKNPFDAFKPYENNWIVLKVINEAPFMLFTGISDGGAFQVIVTKKCDDWKYRMMDFIEYEKSYDKNIILSAAKDDIESAEIEYAGHYCNDRFLRKYEQKVLVHSTTAEGWQWIKRNGVLKSWNMLKLEDKNASDEKPIGDKLEDPYDYSDYIMFTNGGVAGEIIVSSKQKGKIDMDVDIQYRPGARLYFNAEKIAADGLLIRDGVHLKVKDTMQLDKYLMWAATPEEVGICSQESTPIEFSNLCDSIFEKKMGESKLFI